MRTFTLIWFGQLVSAVGSYMTFFAITLWAWETTGSATTLALIGFFVRLPQIPATLFAGEIVDRFDRKRLMLLGDAVTAVATLTVGALYFSQHLQIWHLCAIAMVVGGFSQVQILAYQASLSLIVPKRHYARAGGMAAIVHYGSNIVGPALVGALYPAIGLAGIVAIDLVTFAIAFVTLLAARIPQPATQPAPASEKLADKLAFGFRYVWQRPDLKALSIVAVLFAFAHDLGATVRDPMILARTDGSARVLASVSTAAGFGGVAGAAIASIWGGPKRRVRGMLAGYIGAGLSKIAFGLGRSLPVWVPAQFCSSLNFPLIGSCRSALWMEKIAPEIQGRVFAANSLATQGASIVAVLLAGPLADRWLEPTMMPGGRGVGLLGFVFGSGAGAGTAALYTFCSLAMLLVGVGGFFVSQLGAIETNERDR